MRDVQGMVEEGGERIARGLFDCCELGRERASVCAQVCAQTLWAEHTARRMLALQDPHEPTIQIVKGHLCLVQVLHDLWVARMPCPVCGGECSVRMSPLTRLHPAPAACWQHTFAGSACIQRGALPRGHKRVALGSSNTDECFPPLTTTHTHTHAPAPSAAQSSAQCPARSSRASPRCHLFCKACKGGWKRVHVKGLTEEVAHAAVTTSHLTTSNDCASFIMQVDTGSKVAPWEQTWRHVASAALAH